MARVLIVGESWITNRIHHKGFDLFTDTMFEVGATPLKEALESGGHEVAWMPAHEVQERFPLERSGLAEVDVLVFSDIGALTVSCSTPTLGSRARPRPTA